MSRYPAMEETPPPEVFMANHKRERPKSRRAGRKPHKANGAKKRKRHRVGRGDAKRAWKQECRGRLKEIEGRREVGL